MKKRIIAGTAAMAALAAGGVGFAAASGASAGSGAGTSTGTSTGSRLDDGANLLPQSKITEQQAVKAAQSVASGPLNENDLEDYNGRLVWNIDVGASDVKVDAANGDVLAKTSDD
jgi:uncharacterized membrane protein YkoI